MDSWYIDARNKGAGNGAVIEVMFYGRLQR